MPTAILLCCSCVAQNKPTSPAKAADGWLKPSGEFSIRRSAKDISVSPRKSPNSPILSFQAMAQADWEKIQRDASGQTMEAERTYRLLSAVGPYLSVEEQYDCDCGGAHPSSSKRFRAYDLSKSTSDRPTLAKLTDIFPEDAIFSALLRDPLVSGVLKDTSPEPTSLSELLATLQSKQVQVKECPYYFGSDLMTDFAFYSVDADEVSVRISLSHAAEVCRGQMTQIGIRLPVPGAFKVQFDSARAAKSGFLMRKQEKLAMMSQVSFRFATKDYGK